MLSALDAGALACAAPGARNGLVSTLSGPPSVGALQFLLGTEMVEAAPAELRLLTLPYEARQLVLSRVEPRALAHLQLVCSSLRADATDEALWRQHAAYLLAPAHPPSVSMSERARCAALFDCVRCAICAGRLVRARAVEGGHVHVCECVALRRQLLAPRPELSIGRSPLTIVSLSVERVGESGSVGWAPMADPLRAVLGPAFDLTLRTSATLDASLLSGAHVLIANMTCAREPLSAAEQSALIGFVRAGGTAILNAFCNWSANAACNGDIVHWLGVGMQVGFSFGPRVLEKLGGSGADEDGEEAPNDNGVVGQASTSESARTPEASALLRGPFGVPRSWANEGSTDYALDPRQLGMASPLEVAQRFELAPHLHFINGRPVVGSGRVLLCSNFHWLVDRRGWHGGSLELSGQNDNAVLLRNLCAVACAPRLVEGVDGRLCAQAPAAPCAVDSHSWVPP